MWHRRVLRPVSALRSLLGLNGVADATWAIRADVQHIIDAQAAATATMTAIVEQISALQAKTEHREERAIEAAMARISGFNLDQAPPMQIAADWPAADAERLWDYIAETWTNLGASEPYWSVLIDEANRLDNLNAEGIERFFGSGKYDIDRMHSWFTRHDRTVPCSGTIAEYGCGVGRLTSVLANQFAHVKAYDISRPHLRICQERLDSQEITNAELINVSNFQSLELLSGYDVFYSLIVLQHNPPPLIAAIIRQALRGLNAGGFGFFQVPTYAREYRFDLEQYIGRLRGGAIGGMEMHLLPQETVFRLIAECGCAVLEVRPDGYVGSYENWGWLSNTFFVEKR